MIPWVYWRRFPITKKSREPHDEKLKLFGERVWVSDLMDKWMSEWVSEWMSELDNGWMSD